MLPTEQNSATLEERLQERQYVRNLRELVTERLLNFPKCSRLCLEELSTWPMARASWCATPHPKFGLWTTFEHHNDCGWLKCHVDTSHQWSLVNITWMVSIWAWHLRLPGPEYCMCSTAILSQAWAAFESAIRWNGVFSSSNNDIEDVVHRKAKL